MRSDALARVRCAAAGRQRAARALRGLAHESAGALDRGGGDAGPGGAPEKMRNRHHGLGVNPVVAHGQDLLGWSRRRRA